MKLLACTVCLYPPLLQLLIYIGVEPTGLKVGMPAPFTVETFAAGNGAVLVYVTDPDGHEEELKASPNNDKIKTYSVVYHPVVPGEYRVR